MERTCRDEKDIIGFYYTVLRGNRAPLDYRQNIALNALSRYVLPAALFGAVCDFIYFVDKDDSLFFGSSHALSFYGVVVDQFVALFGNNYIHCFFDGDLSLFLALGHKIAEYRAERNFGLHTVELKRFDFVVDFDFDIEIIVLSVAKVG